MKRRNNMKKIKINEMVLIPGTSATSGALFVELVKIDTGEISIPNMETKNKTMEFGEVMFASEYDQKFVGKVILVDPFRATPSNVNGKVLHQLLEHKPTLVMDKKEFEEYLEEKAKYRIADAPTTKGNYEQKI